mmetsp:Transcript_89374/g.139914  ORF Transcript_89374/g.139914 Transcript_89374/m.139914 type:complete len:201 (-) Transcript_89374:480-1082(-)
MQCRNELRRRGRSPLLLYRTGAAAAVRPDYLARETLSSEADCDFDFHRRPLQDHKVCHPPLCVGLYRDPSSYPCPKHRRRRRDLADLSPCLCLYLDLCLGLFPSLCLSFSICFASETLIVVDAFGSHYGRASCGYLIVASKATETLSFDLCRCHSRDCRNRRYLFCQILWQRTCHPASRESSQKADLEDFGRLLEHLREI